MEQGIIRAVCISPAKGTEKQNIHSARIIENWGLENDAHAGDWHRQVSLLSYQKVVEFNRLGANVTTAHLAKTCWLTASTAERCPSAQGFSAGMFCSRSRKSARNATTAARSSNA